jgi:protein SCO1/2
VKRYLFIAILAVMAVSSGIAATATEVVLPQGVGIDEKPGAFVPLDTRFVAEDGSTVTLRDVIKGPTVLSIFYFKCQNACDYLLSSLASVLRQLGGSKSGEPNLVSVSIDETETPADAIAAQRMSLEMIERPFPASKWRFLTSPDTAAINRLCDSVGYHFRRNGTAFDHPLGLIVLSPKGKIVRYMNGSDFLPLDVSMSLLEASAGLARPTIAKVLRFCLSYNPQSRQFGFNLLRVSGIVITALVGAFVLYLVLSGKRRRRGAQGR